MFERNIVKEKNCINGKNLPQHYSYPERINGGSAFTSRLSVDATRAVLTHTRAPPIAADSYGREGSLSFVINQRGHFVTT